LYGAGKALWNAAKNVAEGDVSWDNAAENASMLFDNEISNGL